MQKRILLTLIVFFLVLGGSSPNTIQHDVENEPRMTCVMDTSELDFIEEMVIEYYGAFDEADRIVQTLNLKFDNQQELNGFLEAAKKFDEKYQNHPYIKHTLTIENNKIEEILDVNVKKADIEDLIDINLIPEDTSKSISMGLTKEQYQESPMNCKIIGEEDIE